MIVDHREPAAEEEILPHARSHDVEEADAVTNAAFDGAARGYGARILLVGGLEAFSRVGPADPVGVLENLQSDTTNDAMVFNDPTVGGAARAAVAPLDYPVTSPCLAANRG